MERLQKKDLLLSSDKMKKKFIQYWSIVLIMFMPLLAYSQQQPMYSQYMFNGMALNPAYAGSHESLSLTAISRHQWVGIDGAPSTQTFTAHAPVKNERVGLGVMLMRDKIGVTNHLSSNFAYAYKIPLRKGVLSAGLQASFNQYKINYSELHIENDIAFGQDDVSRILLNFGTGLYYSTSKFYAGFSVPQLMKSRIEDAEAGAAIALTRHYFFTSGYVFTLSPDLKLKPNVLLKATEGAPLSADFNANLLVREVVWVGLSYRSFNSCGALLELQATDQFRFGYAYDFLLASQVKGWNTGSHEFMLSYNFTFSKNRFHSPRYF